MSEKETNRRQLDLELDRLENKISELRVLYEQYFVEILPLSPDKQQKEIVALIRKLLHAPFKNSQTRFRLRVLVQRYQTYATYWERVQKQKEEGTYSRDLFKAEMREKMLEEAKLEHSAGRAADRGRIRGSPAGADCRRAARSAAPTRSPAKTQSAPDR